MYSKPDWIRDRGSAAINLTNLDIKMHLIPYSKQGKLQVDFSNVEIDIDNYECVFNGTSDFSKALGYTLQNFKTFFKNEVGTVLASGITEAFKSTMNSFLFEGAGIYPIVPNQIYLNSTLTGNPIFNKDFITLPMDGTFLDANMQNNAPRHHEFPSIPSFHEKGKQMQIFISQSSLSTAIYAYHKANLLKIEYNDIDPSVIDLIFNGFKSAYGGENKVTVVVDAEEPTPRLEMTKDKTHIISKVKIHIRNPYRPDYDAVLVVCDLVLDVKLQVKEKFLITGEVQDIQVDVVSVKANYLSQTNKAKVQEKIKLFVSTLKTTMNDFMSNGLKIPMPAIIESDFKNPNLQIYDGYMLIEASPAHKDPVEPVDPIDPVKPVEPVEPVGPEKPVDPVGPVGPEKPVEPPAAIFLE